MANFIDYLYWRGDLTFKQSEFNEVDNLIFSMLSYFDFEDFFNDETMNSNLTLETVGKRFFLSNNNESIMKKPYQEQKSIELLKIAYKTKRFKNVIVKHYLNIIDLDKESQFCAMVFEFGEYTDYIAFRGTDHTLIGWKEDFRMCYLSNIPSQLEAVKYLNRVGVGNREIILGGHSKGGNLAIFSGTKCNISIKSRILTIYNNDGPGFNKEWFLEDDYMDIKEIVKTFIPPSSIVGLFLEHDEDYTIIKSSVKGIFQHDLFSWKVKRNKLIYLKKLTKETEDFNSSMKSWLNNLTINERESFIDDIFSIFENVDITTVDSIWEKRWAVLKTISSLDNETKKNLRETAKKFIIENLTLSNKKK